MKHGTFYSIKEFAERLDVSWNTVLEWKYKYLFSLPALLIENQLKYPATTLGIFQFIKDAEANGLHDDVIQLCVDKQAEPIKQGHIPLESTLDHLTQTLKKERDSLFFQSLKTSTEQQERFLAIMKDVSWEEIKQLQKQFPDEISIEEDIQKKTTDQKQKIGGFFQRALYNSLN